MDKYPSFAEDLFTFKFVKIFETNQKILHKISTLLLRNEKYRVNKFAKSNEPPTNFSYTDSSPPPATWMANKNAKNTHFWTNERDSTWRVAIVSVPWTVHEYHRATIVSRLLYTFDPERVPRTIETRGSGDFLGYCWRRDRKRTRNGDV